MTRDTRSGDGSPAGDGVEGRIFRLLPERADPLATDGPDVVAGLSATPKRIDPKYVYDRRGTELFEQQCGTPEYYLRRAEFRLLSRHAAVITELCGYPALIELGAGTAEKTRILFARYGRRRMRCDYFPIDVDSDTLDKTAHALVADHPLLRVHWISAEYTEGLRALPAAVGPRLFAFLGSSIGNMSWPAASALLAAIHQSGRRGDFLLVGADLDKEPATIDRAYNDSAGYGARSTLNMLAHLNWRYGGDFDLEGFDYVSRYEPAFRQNIVRLVSRREQRVTLTTLNFSVIFRAGETIDAEVMVKFDPDELSARLNDAGFAPLRHWVDPVYRYGLFLLARQ